jgi:flagella basal body P-ring formation protein FlgA
MRSAHLMTVFAALNLPLAAPVSAAEGAMYPVVTRTLYAGDTIGEDVVAMKPIAGQAPGAGSLVTDPQGLIGKAARRTLLPNQPIPKVAIREPYVVLQNKTIPLMFQSGAITITGEALALQSGSVGDTVSARNPDSGIVIRGVIQSDGSLRTE